MVMVLLEHKTAPTLRIQMFLAATLVAGLMILDVSTERNAFIFKGQGVVLLGLLARDGVIYWF
jgi:hypothetical protein